MKTQLLKNVFGSILVTGLLFFSVHATAQNLKTTADDGPVKGHELYKNAKIYDSKSGPVGAKPKAFGDRAMDRWNYEFGLLKNPFTGEIPKNILKKEAAFAKKSPRTNLAKEAAKQFTGKTVRRQFSYFKNRGPFNVGGRTRALAIDRNNENVILAGGVSGGLWRSEDQGQSWRRVTRIQQSPSITAIVQDPRPGRGNIWYYASGERFGNSPSAGGAFYPGSGIYQSYDGGLSFNQLRSTDDNDPTSFTAFDIINSLAVDPDNGDLYAATFNGLYRSQNLNGARTFDQLIDSGFDRTTEVMITPEGKIYVTIDVRSANAGFFVSDDGENFTNITPENIVPVYGRTVMAHDPSDENRIYFFSSDLTGGTPAFLWRYQADAESESERWVELTANLPVGLPGLSADLDLQGSYNMIIKVHPTNPDLVFLGGTNLYRSNTGFTTPLGNTGKIGGYNINNSFALYPNHHPDQHNLLFLPSNPNRAISGNDGGVQITEDITQVTPNPAIEDVDWISLNNGYITTQPYVVAIDPDGNSDDVVAGFQDNGSWFTGSKDPRADWESDLGGDGSFNAIADGGLTRYVSAQSGVVFRLNFDEAGNEVSFTRVQPAGPAPTSFRFIAPFRLDPLNDNIMYMPAGDRIWRNNDLDEIPIFSNATTDVNWVEQTQTATPDGSEISALDVSRFPISRTLYYGTTSGRVFKVENANLDDQEVVDISTNKGLPAGNINDVYVDRNNDKRVFVVFSNYGIPSLFMTENGGDSWTNISGNLEQNPDGSGNGPSVRSFAISGNNNIYFVGTSTGLYITYNLNGQYTSWYRESGVIGDAVVMDVQTREDGYMALAAHGNGVFDAAFYAAPSPQSKLSVAYLLPDVTVPIGADPFEVDVTDLFVSSQSGANISIELTNSNPDLVTAELNGNTISVSIAAGAKGTSAIGLIATSGNERVAEGFTVNVVEPALYEQVDPIVSSTPSQFFADFGAVAQSADDFIVPADKSWTVKSVVAFGAANNGPQLNDATVIIYSDNNGAPGEIIYNSGSISPISAPTNTNLELELPEEVELNGGSYWLSVYANLAFGANAQQWFWSTQANVIGNESAFRDDGLFVGGGIDWIPRSLLFGNTPDDLVFQIFGTSQDAGSEATVTTPNPDLDLELENQALAEIEAAGITTVWPNPSSSEFFFQLNDSKDAKINAKVFNILGQLVYEKDDIDTANSFSWNAESSPAGFYLVKINGANTNRSFSIIKR